MDDFPKPEIKHPPTPLVTEDLSSHDRVAGFLARLLPRTRAGDPAAALLPWVCDRLPSEWSSPGKVDTGLSFIPSVRTRPGTRTPATSAVAECCRRPRCTRRPPHGPRPAWRSPRRGPT